MSRVRGSVDGVSMVAAVLLVAHPPSIVRDMLLGAGVPRGLIDEGVLSALDERMKNGSVQSTQEG